MPRFRTVLLTAAAAALLLAVWMSLPGCGRDKGPDLRQELAREQQRREVAESESRRWQNRALWLGGAAVLALVVGAALGSKARDDARRDSPHGPQK